MTRPLLALVAALAPAIGCTLPIDHGEPPPAGTRPDAVVVPPDAWVATCTRPYPGTCRPAECGISCGGELYRCIDGDWAVDSICEPCITPPLQQAEVEWTFTVTTTCGRSVAAPPVQFATAPDGLGGVSITRIEPAGAALSVTSYGGNRLISRGQCVAPYQLTFTMPWGLDGRVTAVDGVADLTLSSGTFAVWWPSAVTGTFVASAAGGCQVSGTVAGTWAWL